MLSNKQISLIGAPVDIGAGRRGVDMGPSALRHAGLRDRLTSLGYSVIDEGNVNAPLAETLPLPPANDKLRYLEPLRSFFPHGGLLHIMWLGGTTTRAHYCSRAAD